MMMKPPRPEALPMMALPRRICKHLIDSRSEARSVFTSSDLAACESLFILGGAPKAQAPPPDVSGLQPRRPPPLRRHSPTRHSHRVSFARLQHQRPHAPAHRTSFGFRCLGDSYQTSEGKQQARPSSGASMGDIDDVSQEFAIWKKNSPFLYDLVIAHSLTWPSLTLQWLPGTREGNDCTVHRLLLGTHTSEEVQDAQNQVIVADVHVPDDTAQHPNKDETEVGTGSGIKSSVGIVTPVIHLAHEGEVNRARYCPHKPDIVASKAIDGDVYIFDTSKQGKPHRVDPVARLKGHKEEGWGLAWSPLREGHVLSGSNDALVCLWDTAAASGKSINATATYAFHTGTVGDVAWHSTQDHTFASVGDDGKLFIYDSRKPADSAAVEQVDVQGGDCNCVAFHPTNQHLLALSAGPSIGLYDMRNIGQRLHMLAHHTEDVYQIGWNPHHETILASSAGDRRVMLWDLSAIGEEQAQEDAEDGPPELRFVHGGHTSKISDLSWNPNPGSEWMLASTADDNFLQVYTPSATALLG